MDMASTPLSPVLRYIRKIVDLPASAQVTDSQLLDRFVRHRNEAAFSALVERHGPMVMGICRRLLCNSHDAEDAFQATFLVLVRRAEDIGDPDLLANWLYGVAYRTAAKAKADVLRRRAREGQAASNHQANAPRDQDLWDDVRPILDEEINLLPVKYRTPVVLCYLQGKTNEEAARQLGWPKGTVATRLARARERLRHRLTRRGMVLSTAVMATTLSQATASGALPARVVNGAVQTALLVVANQGVTAGVVANQIASLTEGVLKTMVLAKLKTVALVVSVVGIAGIGAGAVAYGWKTAGPTDFQSFAPTQVAHTWEARSVQLEGDPARHDEEEPPTIIPPAVALPPVPTDPRKETFRTPNFQVEAPTSEIAFKVGQAAERHRKELSLLWLAKELPPWQDFCRIQVNITPYGSAGATSTSFAEGKVSGQIMNLGGPLETILANTLPHEMTHVILAHSFGQPLPRWADEGAAIMAEGDKERKHHEAYMNQTLSRAIPLRKLLSMSDYPPEALALFAEGYSLTRFLVESVDRQRFLTFVAQGMREGWDKAVKAHYSYENVEDLEKAWLGHLHEIRSQASPSQQNKENLPASKKIHYQIDMVVIEIKEEGKKVLSQPCFTTVEDKLETFRLGGQLARPLDPDHKSIEFIPVGPTVNVKVKWKDHGSVLLETSVENCDPIKTSDQELQVLTKKVVTIKEVKLGQVEKIILQKSDRKKDQVLMELTVTLAEEG
jgi:RNA polymerase sigma factor (sigma-70 family)